MKILMVTPFYYPIVGGTESFIENISIKLNEKGILTDIMTFNIDQTWKPWSINQIRKSKIEKINAVDVIKIPALTLLPTRILFRTNFIPSRFLDKFEDYDIIHFHNDIDLSFPLFSYSVDKPKIFHCHCLGITYNSYKKNPLHKRILKKMADVYIVQSISILKLLVDLDIPETKIRVVPNAIDTERFRPSEETKIENLLLFVGRLDPKKGLCVLLKALNYIKTKVQLVIIGPPSRPWFYKKILALIKETNKGTMHKVIYLGAHKPEEILKWYQKASIFVCPSLSESFPVVNLEALSMATPVVATNVGATEEVIKNYENGILVSPNDAVKLAEGIQFLLDNEKIRRKFGQYGRKWVVENFSCDAVVERLCKIYDRMI
ncbi:glycosyltransferase family 4 protein [Candidatus Bathyarchaeota archaeon]|nr:glycosyltransferase family 4 protein [Candidatus Bathyarchaeota archaeon]